MEKALGPLLINTLITKKINVIKNSVIESVFIKFGTYCRKNNSNLFVSIKIKNKEIEKKKIKTSILNDNCFHEVKLKNIINTKKSEEITIQITSDCKNHSESVAIFYDDEKDNYFYVNDTKVKGELSLEIKYKKTAKKNKPHKHIGKTGLISVIIPHYNCLEYLDKCLKSVLRQTYNFIEIIIVDDCSEDEDSLNSLIKKNNDQKIFPIKLFRNKINKGAPATRNKGFKESSGEFLFFLDADTYLEPNAFEDMINVLHNNPDCSYAYCRFKWGSKTVQSCPFNPQSLKRFNFISMMSLIRKIDFPLKGIDESLKRYQDWDLWLRMLKNKKTGVWINKCLFFSEERINSISNGGSISDKESRKILSKKHPWAKIPINL